MNQMHGVEIINYYKNDLILKDCTIQDNFCDGINFYADNPDDIIQFSQINESEGEELEEGRENIHTESNQEKSRERKQIINKDKSKLIAQSQNLKSPSVQLQACKIQSNKNCGVNLSSALPPQTWYYMYANSFRNNLNTDLYFSDEQPYQRLKLLKAKGLPQQSNTFDQQIQRNFDITHLLKHGQLRVDNLQNQDNADDDQSDDAQTDQQDIDDLKILEMSLDEDQLYLHVYGHAKGKRNLKSIPNGDRKNFGRSKGEGILSNSSIVQDDSARKPNQKRQLSISSCFARLCQPCGNIKGKRYQSKGSNQTANTSVNNNNKTAVSANDTTAHTKAHHMQLGRQAMHNSFERQVNGDDQFSDPYQMRDQLQPSQHLSNSSRQLGTQRQLIKRIPTNEDIGTSVKNGQPFQGRNHLQQIGNQSSIHSEQNESQQQAEEGSAQQIGDNQQNKSHRERQNQNSFNLEQHKLQGYRSQFQQGINMNQPHGHILSKLESSRNTNISLFKEYNNELGNKAVSVVEARQNIGLVVRQTSQGQLGDPVDHNQIALYERDEEEKIRESQENLMTSIHKTPAQRGSRLSQTIKKSQFGKGRPPLPSNRKPNQLLSERMESEQSQKSSSMNLGLEEGGHTAREKLKDIDKKRLMESSESKPGRNTLYDSNMKNSSSKERQKSVEKDANNKNCNIF